MPALQCLACPQNNWKSMTISLSSTYDHQLLPCQNIKNWMCDMRVCVYAPNRRRVVDRQADRSTASPLAIELGT